MSAPVFFHPQLTSLQVGGRVDLAGAEAHHALRVLRLRVGDHYDLTDGHGQRVNVEAETIADGVLHGRVLAVNTLAFPDPHVTLVQAVPKGSRGELAVELATEIGVNAIVPWAASRCVSRWRGARGERSWQKWQNTAQAASKQSRRSWWPELHPLATTAQVVALVEAADMALILHESAERSITQVPIPTSGSVVIVVGPEGGISPEERSVLGADRCVRLGPTVLRTSTAGAAAAVAVLSQTSRWEMGSQL